MNKNFVAILILIALLITVSFIFNSENKKEIVNQGDVQIIDKEVKTNMKNQIVVLQTNFGDIEIELFTEKAPNTVANFIKLAESGFYDGTRFHRVIRDFMIQGGDPLSKDLEKIQFWGTGSPGYRFADERNDVELAQGVIAMANSGPNTNGSQFFIVTSAETLNLPGWYTPFGKVINGLDVALKIEIVETKEKDRPLQDVLLEKVVIKK